MNTTEYPISESTETCKFMGTKQKLLNLLHNEENMPVEIQRKISQRVEQFWTGITKDAGLFLHFDIDDKKHSRDEIKALVRSVPESLSHELKCSIFDDDQNADLDEDISSTIIPIQSTVFNCRFCGEYNAKAISFIPLLVEEGCKVEMGRNGMRGGLLKEQFESGQNVLQLLAKTKSRTNSDNFEIFDLACVSVMKSLREKKLLKKRDIRKYNLLRLSLYSEGKHRFEFLVDWDPIYFQEHLLKELRGFSCLTYKLLLKSCSNYCPEHISLVASRHLIDLREEMNHLPKLGILKEEQLRKRAWGTIKACLDYAGPNKVLSLNGGSNLYPFISAAVGSQAYLDIVYYLFRQHPMILNIY